MAAGMQKGHDRSQMAACHALTRWSSFSPKKMVDTGSIDTKAIKVAEAKYEHDLKEIEQKDKQFDLTLTKLETERQALTTEYESVKKVVEENIDRTFN